MIKVGIVGASGYAGGEILRILLQHGEVSVAEVSSKRYEGKQVSKVHTNLKGLTELRFSKRSPIDIATDVDIIFLAVPHGESVKITPEIVEQGTRVVDMSADFRLNDPDDYPRWYGWEHSAPDLLSKFAYGIPEIHREEIRSSRNISGPGCTAACSIYGLAPYAKAGLIDGLSIVDTKVGSSAAGSNVSLASNHSEHSNSVRIYKPWGHRHIAEIEQELSHLSGKRQKATMSAHSVNMVRGILATSSFFTDEEIEESKAWKIVKSMYSNEPFVRYIMDKSGVYRFPDPKIVIGSNFADVGFDYDKHGGRMIAISAIDNLIKGAAGSAIQSMNIMMGFKETEGLTQAPLHPV